MCMKSTPEGCELRDELKEVKTATAALDTRLTKVEHDVAKIRSESAEGFKAGAEAMHQLNASISNLAHDFGSRMNSMDARLVEEKVKWGDTLRGIVKWTAKVVLICVLAAVGLNYCASLYKMIFVN